MLMVVMVLLVGRGIKGNCQKNDFLIFIMIAVKYFLQIIVNISKRAKSDSFGNISVKSLNFSDNFFCNIKLLAAILVCLYTYR